MEHSVFALKGILVHTPAFDSIEYHENKYVVCKDGHCVGIFDTLPEEYSNIRVYDYTDKFIVPGMADMHVHASQYGFRGIGMLLDCNSEWETWFDRYSFPEESRFADLDYADKAYTRFVDDLLKTTTTTRASIFATIPRPAPELLMRKLADAGFSAYVGKLNMDRNSRFGLQETTEESLAETERWIQETQTGYGAVKPMITPRYTPTCTDKCMEGLGALSEKYQVPVQSHLSEGLDEIEWVKKLKPGLSCYGEAYDMYGMLGSKQPTVMAHVVHPNAAEYELLRHRNVLVASKLRWVYTERNGEPFAKKRFMTIANAFYLATKGGGAFFGKVGSFEPDYEFDAVVLDDAPLADFVERPLPERLLTVTHQSKASRYR